MLFDREANVRRTEVEIRALVGDVGGVRSTLEELGAKKVRTCYIRDSYFCNAAADQWEQVEMNSVGSFSLRLRKVRSDDETAYEINTKTITTEGDHGAWEEHETRVACGEEAQSIFLAIGFKKFAEIRKWRQEYDYRGKRVAIDSIEGFGHSIEIEEVVDGSDVERARKEVRELLEWIGVEEEEIVDKSVTNMVMERRMGAEFRRR